MKPGILIISPYEEWAKASSECAVKKFECEYALSGKEGQLKIYKNNYTYVYVHLDTKNNSGLEVVRYIHNGFPQIKIFVLVGEKILADYGVDETMLKRLGVTKVLSSLKSEDILIPIQSIGSLKKWQDVEAPENKQESTETEIGDSKFTRI